MEAVLMLIKIRDYMNRKEFFNQKAKSYFADKNISYVFQALYEADKIRAFRWIKTEPDAWVQDFWIGDSAVWTPEGIAFSFEQTLLDRIVEIGATHVDFIHTWRSSYSGGNTYPQILEKKIKEKGIAVSAKFF